MSPPSSRDLALGVSLGLSALVGCGSEPAAAERAPEHVEPVPAPAHAVAPALAPRVAAAALTRLRESVVTDADFARRILYTWTTAEQATALEAAASGSNVAFLSRDRMRDGDPGLFGRALAYYASHPPATPDARRPVELLTRAGYRFRRFAWPTPWATRVGLFGSDYGDRLVRVELAPDAIIARFVVTSRGTELEAEPWTFVDLEQRPVPLDVVLQHPARLAAIYHVHVQPEKGLVLREYVLVNESRIASFALGTDAVRDELARDVVFARDAVALLESTVTELDGDAAIAAMRAAITRPSNDLASTYLASLAFVGPTYAPDRASMQGLVDALVRSQAVLPAQATVAHPRRAFALGPPLCADDPSGTSWGDCFLTT